MAFDNHANFAAALVATAPAPATTGLSLSVAAGYGAIFPAAPFNATVRSTGCPPFTVGPEIIRVTAKAGDVFTIVRAQEGTAARAIVVGDFIEAAVTAKTITDIEVAVTREVRSDTVSATSYIGHAISGSSESASVWTIKRTIVASGGTITSNLTASMVEWDDRLTATYT